MLTGILKLLEQNEGELDCIQLSQHLGAQPSAVAGMIETLVRKGRLVEVRPTCGPCDSCDLSNECRLPALRAKRYVTVNRRTLGAPE